MEHTNLIKVNRRLREQLDEVLKKLPIYDWFLIAVNGSWNYDMETEYSDIDSKLLVIPSLEQLIDNEQLNTLYLMRDNNEHVEVKDIRLYFKTMLKQNVNFIETIYAQAYIVNPKYIDLFDILIDMRDTISGCNPIATLKCIRGDMHQKYKQMTKVSPGRLDSINKFGYDLKSFHHLMRLSKFGDNFMSGEKYENCLTNCKNPLIKKYLVSLKMPEYAKSYSLALCIADGALWNMDKKITQYEEKLKPLSKDFQSLSSDVEDILKELSYNIIKRAIFSKGE